VAVEKDLVVVPLEDGNWQAYLVADDSVEFQPAEVDEPERGEE